MENKKVELLGYHGTKKDIAKQIEKSDFTESEGGWLGKGIYFFQEDYEMARNWASKKYNTVMTAYIKRKIEVSEEKFFDITWPLDERTKYYFKEREKYVEEMERRGYSVEVETKKRFEGKLIDLICKKKKFEVARSCTFTYQKFDEIYKLNSIFANGVEICVKNPSCISK